MLRDAAHENMEDNFSIEATDENIIDDVADINSSCDEITINDIPDIDQKECRDDEVIEEGEPNQDELEYCSATLEIILDRITLRNEFEIEIELEDD